MIDKEFIQKLIGEKIFNFKQLVSLLLLLNKYIYIYDFKKLNDLIIFDKYDKIKKYILFLI